MYESLLSYSGLTERQIVNLFFPSIGCFDLQAMYKNQMPPMTSHLLAYWKKNPNISKMSLSNHI